MHTPEPIISLRDLKANQAVICYRLPNSKVVKVITGEAHKVNDLQDVLGGKGFAFIPSVTAITQAAYFIKAQQEWELQDIEAAEWDINISHTSDNQPYIASKSEYLQQAENMIAAIRSGRLEKVILSRIKKHDVTSFRPWEAFKTLCKLYPTVMVYWVSIPGMGSWMGATPETLIKVENGQAETVSLAGTQRDQGVLTEQVTWGDKEQEEQGIVSRNIEKLVQEHFPNATLQHNGPKTINTGSLLHLKTEYNWNTGPADAPALAGFIQALHPTPAISGHPKATALTLIKETEPHDRAYYTGLLGPVDGNGLTHLFVNLRCMQIFEDYLALYAGGGLTAHSLPEAEWQETELKAETLLRVV